MSIKGIIKEAILNNADSVKDIATVIIDQKEDLALTECTKGEIDLLGKTYVIYSMHGLFMYGEKGSTAMMSEAEFIQSLTPNQIYVITQLGLNPQPIDNIQEFCNNADRL